MSCLLCELFRRPVCNQIWRNADGHSVHAHPIRSLVGHDCVQVTEQRRKSPPLRRPQPGPIRPGSPRLSFEESPPQGNRMPTLAPLQAHAPAARTGRSSTQVLVWTARQGCQRRETRIAAGWPVGTFNCAARCCIVLQPVWPAVEMAFLNDRAQYTNRAKRCADVGWPACGLRARVRACVIECVRACVRSFMHV